MQLLAACSIFGAILANAQELCNICNFPRVIPEGAQYGDNGDPCGEHVNYCKEYPAVCGATCPELTAFFEPPCCPVPDGFCDICQGRQVLEDTQGPAPFFSDFTCTEAIGHCATNDCGLTCEELVTALDPTCCKQPPTTTTTTTSTTTTRRPTAPLFQSVNNTKILYIDPKLQWGAHVALLAGSWMIRAEGTYQAHNRTTLSDSGDTTCDGPLVDNQLFTGMCHCHDVGMGPYGKCKLSLFYNFGAECTIADENSCGVAIPEDGRITTSRAGIVYFQVADTFHNDNNGTEDDGNDTVAELITLTFVKEGDGWRSGAVTSTKTKVTMFLVMALSLLF
jgi:hypothetical protein